MRAKRFLALTLCVSLLSIFMLSVPARAAVWYRVRRSWADAASQKGAFSSLSYAINAAKALEGYAVFGENGEQSWPELASSGAQTGGLADSADEPKDAATGEASADTPLSEKEIQRLTPELKAEYERAQQVRTAAIQQKEQASAALAALDETQNYSSDQRQKRAWLSALERGETPIPKNNTHYYNLFNIGATPDVTRIDGARINAIYYAMGLRHSPEEQAHYMMPWNTPERAALGGTKIIREVYIDRGQDSVYFQKFNVSATATSPAWRQYMQGIEAPKSESQQSYRAYRDSQSLQGAIVFAIPVFDGMPDAGSYTLDSSDLDPERDRIFIEDLKAFPSSYHAGLKSLHQKYPAWRFLATKTRMNWTQSVAFQMRPNVNLIEDNARTNAQGWVKDHKVRDGRNWVQVTEKAVRYHLDPRNFLKEVEIFMFEKQSQLNEAQSLEGVRRILGNNAALQALAPALWSAARETNTSAYLIASRMRVEISEAGGITNSAAGLLDVAYPPLSPGAKSLSYMTPEEQKTALRRYLAGSAALNDPVYRQAKSNLEAAIRAQKQAENDFAAVLGRCREALKKLSASLLRGDLSEDEKINLVDLVMMRQALLGIRQLSDAQMLRADLNQDGRLGVADLVMLRQHLLGIRSLSQ